jgi:hypothetical protein
MPHQITISDEDFAVLSKWASVSRTLKEAHRLLVDYLESEPIDHNDDIINCCDELKELTQPLDNVNTACKEAKHRAGN